MRLTALMAIALAAPPTLAAQDGSLLDRIRTTMNLPVRTAEARDAGVPDERVRGTVWDIFRSGVPAEDATRIFDEEVRIVREGGSKDNFGAFVRSRVEAGVRGRELAEQIHREHERRRMGKPDDAGKGRDADRPTQAGGQGQDGRPGQAGGKPEDRRPAQAQDQGQGQSRDNAGAGRGRKP